MLQICAVKRPDRAGIAPQGISIRMKLMVRHALSTLPGYTTHLRMFTSVTKKKHKKSPDTTGCEAPTLQLSRTCRFIPDGDISSAAWVVHGMYAYVCVLSAGQVVFGG